MKICVDIGGGTTRIGFSIDGKSFASIVKFETLKNFNDQINKIIDEIKKQTSDVEKVSFAAAGVLDSKQGRIIHWGQRHSWSGKSVFESLHSAFPNAILKLENDADVAALGEAAFGAGAKFSIVGFLTLSTGIGGGLIINNKIVPHKLGFEPGHQILNVNENETWNCGQKGCFESYASGTAFKKIFGMPGEDCDDPKIWEQYAINLAQGVANVLVFWSPEVLILGGGISNKAKYFIGPLKREAKKLLPNFEIPEIVRAKLDEPGLYGGLAL